jgi:YesN/AraC family two-component response regulator
MSISLLIADDQALVRRGFRLLLEIEDDLEIVGEAADGAEAVELVARLRPDVVLMDVRMPTVDGIEATRRVMALPGTVTRCGSRGDCPARNSNARLATA